MLAYRRKKYKQLLKKKEKKNNKTVLHKAHAERKKEQFMKIKKTMNWNEKKNPKKRKVIFINKHCEANAINRLNEK